MKLPLLLTLAIPFCAAAHAQNCPSDLRITSPAGFSTIYPFAISSNGSTVVGSIFDSQSFEQQPFGWSSSGGLVVLDVGLAPGGEATHVSRDGTVVVGTLRISHNDRSPVRWVNGQLAAIPLPVGINAQVIPNGVSDDGSLVCGSYFGSSSGGFLWSPSGGYQFIEPPGLSAIRVRHISNDGSTCLGTARDANGEALAFLWDVATGTAQSLAPLAVGNVHVIDISSDGRVAIGETRGPTGDIEPVRWFDGGPPESLQHIFEDRFADSELYSLVDGGSRVYGRSRHQSGLARGIYSESLGLRLVAPIELRPRDLVSEDGDWLVRLGTDGSEYLVRRLEILGENYCPDHVRNSTGCRSIAFATGSDVASANALTLVAEWLPANTSGIFLVAPATGLVFQPPGSAGVLCLGGAIGRFIGPGQILNSGSNGTFSLNVDLNAIPSGSGTVAVGPGETWMFQAWHRDTLATDGSNFTSAVAVTFR